MRFRTTVILLTTILVGLVQAQPKDVEPPAEAQKRLDHHIGQWNIQTDYLNRHGEVVRTVKGTDQARYILDRRVVELITELARAFPETTIILNHFGGPLGIGPYANYREAVFAQWKQAIATLSQCPNVFAKLGGMAMPINGFGWDTAERPATSDEIVEAQRPYYLHTIEHFGPDRCMFESNFPVEKVSVSYHVLWNAFKKIAAGFTEDEKEALFHGTALRAYRLEPIS